VWVISLVGGVRGSLGVTTVAASELFGAMAHTAVGTVVAVGRMIYPSLREGGYNERFSVGLIASSGAIAVVIPPSIAMIIYSVSAQQSAIALFTAGILPSLLIGIVDAIYVLIYARIKMVPLTAPARWEAIWASTKDASWSIGTLVVIFGGIYGGIFTPTEAAAVAAIYAFVIAVFVYRDIGMRHVPKVLVDAGRVTVMLMFIIANALLFAHVLTTERIPQVITEQIVAMGMTQWQFLIVVNVLLLIAGNFMEPTGIILILAPILFPIATELGIDPVHLGVIMTVNMEIGMVTPPVGLNLFVTSGITGMSVVQVVKAALPWLSVLFVFLIIVTYVPAITLWLPNLLY